MFLDKIQMWGSHKQKPSTIENERNFIHPAGFLDESAVKFS